MTLSVGRPRTPWLPLPPGSSTARGSESARQRERMTGIRLLVAERKKKKRTCVPMARRRRPRLCERSEVKPKGARSCSRLQRMQKRQRERVREEQSVASVELEYDDVTYCPVTVRVNQRGLADAFLYPIFSRQTSPTLSVAQLMERARRRGLWEKRLLRVLPGQRVDRHPRKPVTCAPC